MAKQSDVTLSLPTEYLDALSAVFSAGLKHAYISSQVRIELRDWWAAEKEMIESSLDDE